MAETLNEIERRVLGALIEKSMTQTQYYPMTLNSLVSACSQKSNRDPLMTLDEDAVWDTLERLRAAGLVSRILPGGVSRVERFRHEVKQMLGWEKPQWAVMAELLLRGPQTVGELRSRCARMYPFETTDAVAAVLAGLGSEDPPRAELLPRVAGQSAARYAHRLYEPAEWEVLSRAPADAVTPASLVAHIPSADSLDSNVPLEPSRSELALLRGELSELRESLADLSRRVERLES